MRIPSEKIDEIRNATDIVELISSATQLKKRGKNFVGLCPFHTEKTPSFTVSGERQMYHCFGCGVGGNVFTFIMEYEKISFVESVKMLAERAGISLPEYTQAEGERASENEQLYVLCRETGLYYHKCLMESAEGKLALEYFHSRGFTDDIIRAFGLGYSPNSWDALLTLAKERGFDLQLMEKAGLLKRREDGTYHDYFRGRVMFPIFTNTGRGVGFGARKIYEDDPLGKYINSPDTPIFNKSRLLYGLFQAKDAIRDKGFVVLVEGYADVLSLHQAGFQNVVASSGTALTVEQIRLISRYAKKIMLIFDADSAGSKATLRSMDLILENDCDVQIVVLAEGDDPDSSIRRIGKEAFSELLANSISFVDFIVRSSERNGKIKTPETETETVRSVVQTIAHIRDELKRNFYIRYVAEKYHLYESTLYRELEKSLRRTHEISELPNPDLEIDKEAGEKKTPGLEHNSPMAEKDLLHAMLEGGENTISYVEEHLDDTLITSDSIRGLIANLFDLYRKGEELNPAALMDKLGNEKTRIILSNLLFSSYSISRRWDEKGVEIEKANPLDVVRDAIHVLKKKALDRRIIENQQRLKEASMKGEDIIKYLEKHQELLKEIKYLNISEENDKKEG